MTFLFWLTVLIAVPTATAILFGARWPFLPYDLWRVWRDHQRDCFQCFNSSRSDGEMTGAGGGLLPPVSRPGPIRGPLSNGRR